MFHSISLPLRDVRIVVALSCFAASTAAADDQSVDRIVVTATRAPTALSSVGDSVTVITADQARASQKTAVADLLSTTPGVTVTRNGGLGGATSLRIRGAETDQTLVLIDGVKLNDPSSVGGAFNFANLLVNEVARIEVLRGAQSTLWGSQAIGGVVNIVTPDPGGPLATTFDVQGGSFETLHATARAEAGNETFGWRVGASYLATDGVSALDDDLGGREDDGYRNVGLNARAVWSLNESIDVEARSRWTSDRSEFDGYPPPSFTFADTAEYGTSDEWVSYVGMKIDSFANRLQHRIGIAYIDTKRDTYDPTSNVRKTFDAEGTNLRYEYQGTLKLDDRMEGVFGAEREHSELSTASPSIFDPHPTPLARNVVLDSVYAHLQVSPVRAFTLTGGVRYDDHESFGDDTSAQVAAAWSVTDATILRASYGEGFKAPTLYQLYSDYGNAKLEPEESDDWDVGIEQRLIRDRIVMSATYFARNTDNMIDFVSCFGVTSVSCATRPNGYYDNVAQTRADGYEVALTAQLAARLKLTANYTGLEARNSGRATSNFGKLRPRRPRDAAAATLTYEWPIALTTTLAAQYVGRTFDNAANTVVLDDYTLIDFRASYRVSQTLEIYGRIENAFDKAYQTAQSYGAPGRGAYLGVRVRL